jgi:LAO/AO transport system kinase
MPPNKKRPEWAPEDAHHDFTTEVMPGVSGGHDGMPGMSTGPRRPRPPKPVFTPEIGAQGVIEGNRTILARAITMIESHAPAHRATATELLRLCLPSSGKSIRIGITGVPGAGKSTFIEAFGLMLCDRGYKVAVLAVDPSSSVSGGSVLGDKTRMEELSRHPSSFIRPSPSGCTLGGVAARTREAMLLCEAAGFDVILVETVGVGQSETAVRGMVDFFLLLQIAGAGDELQGIKKGVIEMADAILVNKADGDNALRAETARGEYNRVLHYLHPFTPGWTPRALSCSAYTGKGVPEVWDLVGEFHNNLIASGVFEKRRREQNVQWLHSLIKEAVLGRFFEQAAVQAMLPDLERAVGAGEIPVAQAVTRVLG